MSDITHLIAALRAGQQADHDGVMVCVSRQACEEAADALTAQAATIAEQATQIEALRAALLCCARKAEALKRDCGMDPFSPQAIRNGQYQSISTTAHIALGTIQGPACAAMQSGKAAEPDATKCRKCNGNMRPGTYLAQTFSGLPDFPGDTHAVTVSPSGPGRLAECLKCDACGHSVTAGKAVES